VGLVNAYVILVAPLAILDSEALSKMVGNFLVLLSHSTMGEAVFRLAAGLAVQPTITYVKAVLEEHPSSTRRVTWKRVS
jgi:hypothetical protein